jgi:hypothetical protein
MMTCHYSRTDPFLKIGRQRFFVSQALMADPILAYQQRGWGPAEVL